MRVVRWSALHLIRRCENQFGEKRSIEMITAGSRKSISPFVSGIYVSGTDINRDVLGYRREVAATPNNSDRENMEARADGVMKLPELPPTCPLSSRFLYTLRWLIIHVAFCTTFEPTDVRR